MAQLKDKDRRVTIVLLGVTGAGKSAFVSVASNKNVAIGHGVEPCTQSPEAVSFTLGDQEVVLIDTPGFDDSYRSDVEILGDIAKWLADNGYIKTHPLDGLILLHPVTHTFVGGKERKRTRLLEKILGDDAYSRVVIATTMWDLGSEDFVKSLGGHGRVGEKGIWNNFLKKGATITRHEDTPESAHRIVNLITSKSKEGVKARTVLHHGLVDNSGPFTKTPLGEELRTQLEEEVDLTWKQLQEHKSERPSKECRRSKDLATQWMCIKWEREKRDLERRLEAQQKGLKKMDSTIIRVLNALANWFR